MSGQRFRSAIDHNHTLPAQTGSGEAPAAHQRPGLNVTHLGWESTGLMDRGQLWKVGRQTVGKGKGVGKGVGGKG